MISQKELDEKHSDVPPDYYIEGVRRNILQKIWHGKRKAVIKKVLDKKGGRLLDLGSHSGYITNYMHGLTRGETWGVDISEEAIKYGRQKYPQIHFRVGDIQDRTPFADEQFDWVTIFDVMEHVPKTSKVAKEANRILKKGGYFVVGVPLEKNPVFKVVWSLWKLSRGRVWNDVHVHKFTPKLLDEAMLNNGFIVEKKIKSHAKTYLVVKYRKK